MVPFMTPLFLTTAALVVFGPWQKIDVSQIKTPVPEYEYPFTQIGSVLPKVVSAPLPLSCAIHDGAKVVGYRFNC
jgi:hypothetical protein